MIRFYIHSQEGDKTIYGPYVSLRQAEDAITTLPPGRYRMFGERTGVWHVRDFETKWPEECESQS